MSLLLRNKRLLTSNFNLAEKRLFSQSMHIDLPDTIEVEVKLKRKKQLEKNVKKYQYYNYGIGALVGLSTTVLSTLISGVPIDFTNPIMSLIAGGGILDVVTGIGGSSISVGIGKFISNRIAKTNKAQAMELEYDLTKIAEKHIREKLAHLNGTDPDQILLPSSYKDNDV